MLCPPGHTICHAMPTRPYHIPCHDRQAIPYTMPCTILCHARQASPFPIPCQILPARQYHTPCHAHQAIPRTMPCPPGHTMPCQSRHTIYHAMPRQAIIYTMPCSPGHTMYLTMPARSYHIPCHTMANDYFVKSCHLSKGANGLVTRCTITCKKSGAMISVHCLPLRANKVNVKTSPDNLKVLAVITHKFQAATTIFCQRDGNVIKFSVKLTRQLSCQNKHQIIYFIFFT